MRVETLNIKELTGYEPMTTFYEDFSIADKFGIEAIVDTYENAFNSWKHDYKYITELVLVLNWKIWRWYETSDMYARLYDKLWRELCQWCFDNLKGEELEYYYATTD